MDFFVDKMLEDSVKAGYDADEIKEVIIMVLKPYFENESVLQKYAAHDQFLTMFSYIVRYHPDEMFSKYLHEVIGCYRLAFLKNKKEVTKMITSTADILSQKENMMWTVKKNTPHNLEGDIYEATYSYMKHLGDNLEIGLKHKLAELYGILKISLGEDIGDYDKILNTKFGVIMQNLIDKKKFSPILMTSFPKLRLSDWRNIAYHSSYEVIGKRIICTYGKNNDSVELTLEMLRKCVAEIIKSCNIIDIGRRVFIFDNLNIWDDVSEEDLKVYDRKDMKINQLKISLISQGFKIRKSEISAQRITIFLNDLKRIENSIEYNLQREIHCTQFLYNIWQKFPLEIIEIIYCEGEGTPLFKYSIEGKVFKNIVNEKFELEHMVPFIKIDKLEKNLILSDEE